MAVGNQTPGSVASEFATLRFTIQQMLSRVSTLTLCRVIECTNEGGVEPVGTVTVQPLVNMMTGAQESFQHKPLYNVPYVRIAGGRNAVIIDPQPGDLGIVGFCSRDISAVKASQDISNPGSFRQFDMADGVYIATCLGAEAPEQYFAFTDEGINIVSPTMVTIQAPTVRILGALEQSNGDASFAQSVDVAGDVTAQGEITSGIIPLTTHRHTGVTAGGGTSGTPTP